MSINYDLSLIFVFVRTILTVCGSPEDDAVIYAVTEAVYRRRGNGSGRGTPSPSLFLTPALENHTRIVKTAPVEALMELCEEGGSG